MITTIHIVENSNDELEIVDSSRLKGGEPYTIRKRYFDEDGEPSYYDDLVNIKHTFKVITSGEFILNDNDSILLRNQ